MLHEACTEAIAPRQPQPGDRSWAVLSPSRQMKQHGQSLPSSVAGAASDAVHLILAGRTEILRAGCVVLSITPMRPFAGHESRG